MLPSEQLRNEISKKYDIDLAKYSWTKDFENEIFSINLDNYLETNANLLGEIYIKGFNIGHCGLTSRYIARRFDNAELCYGKAKILVGTKASPNGEHAWTIFENYLVDSTLMICIPLEEAIKLGYVEEKRVAHSSARMLSEYDVYDREFEKENKTKTK